MQRSMKDADPESYVCFQLGQLCLELGDLSAARGYFDRALQIDLELSSGKPSNNLIFDLFELGKICEKEKNACMARSYWERALQMELELQGHDSADGRIGFSLSEMLKRLEKLDAEVQPPDAKVQPPQCWSACLNGCLPP